MRTYDDVGANADQGSAYVFTRSGTTWTPQAELTAADGAAGDYFGYSVAISGDTIVRGAPYDGVGGTKNRARPTSSRAPARPGRRKRTLTAADGAPGDCFGYSVAISGDTIVVGATPTTSARTRPGSACVFTRSGTTWTPQQTLTAADGAAGDYFGYSVAISGDTIVVGAYC